LGVALKGDIPILLSLDSADVRYNPSFFNEKLRVGAPPDMFSRHGQNWRFPSFRWAEMERDGFAWWRERLQRASRFYHAYRIDHVLGFFRIWGIPEAQRSAELGYYEPALRITMEQLAQDVGLSNGMVEELVQSQVLVSTETGFAPAWHYSNSPAFKRLDEHTAARLRALFEKYWSEQEPLWRKQGLKLLAAIANSTDMLVCGEDLGVVPDCVPEVLQELGILGLRVERWCSDKEGCLTSPDAFPRLTVTTTSTHDSSTLRGWWQEQGWNREQYFARLKLPGACPEYLTTQVCAAILERNLKSNSLIVVLPLQDLFSLHYDLRTSEPDAERINVPGTEAKENWTYRMKLPIESLLSYDAYNSYVTALISARRNKGLGAAASATD
jgi:4-alpha-glucanotransferase